jgi:hypothetical protein
MSAQLEGEWTVEGRCPHGYSARIPFDSLGYLTKPADSSCGEHRPVTKTVHGVETTRPFPETAELTRLRIWREQRKARKALKGVHEWPWS